MRWLWVVAVIGCGDVLPVDGGACSPGTPIQCGARLDAGRARSALFCEAGKWVTFPCLSECYPAPSDAGTVNICVLPVLEVGAACPASSPLSSEHCESLPPAAHTCNSAGVIVATECPNGCKGTRVGNYDHVTCK